MKIAIKWDETKLTLHFPTALVLNRLTAGIVRKSLKKQGVRLTRKQTVLFIKELRLLQFAMKRSPKPAYYFIKKSGIPAFAMKSGRSAAREEQRVRSSA